MSEPEQHAHEASTPTSFPPSVDPHDELADLLGENVVHEIYMFVFHQRSASVGDLVAAGFAETAVRPSLSVLEARGLVTMTDERRWEVVPPSRSLPSLAARLEERARLIRTSLPGLTSAYRAAGQRGDSPNVHGIEYLPNAQALAFAITQCFSQAPTGARVMRRDSIASRKAAFEAMPSLVDGIVGASERRVECVTVLDTDLVHGMSPQDLDWFDKTPHERLMLSGSVPFTAIVSDAGQAVVEVARDELAEGFLITNPGIVDAVAAVVDLVVSTATPWGRTGGENPDDPALTDSEREILHLLALGVPDATIARRLGISSRTFDRRLRTILDALGAATRFQAGVLAGRRGWL